MREGATTWAACEGVEQRDAIDLHGILRGVGVGHHKADVVPGYPRLFDAERPNERMHVLRHALLVVAGFQARDERGKK
jgi:hypothetical protein